MMFWSKLKKYGLKQSIHIFYYFKFEPVVAKVFKIIFSYLKLQDVIIFASHNDFDMNAGALYKYILEYDKKRKYRLIWFVEHLQDKRLPEGVEQVSIRGVNIRRYYWNSIAKLIFYDDTHVLKWKEGQKTIYLGHATRAMKNCRGKVPLPQSIDYVCSSSEDNDELMSDVYMCEKKKMFHTGFPVTDLLYNKWNEIVKLGIDTNYKKIIIWMPTFRKSSYNALRNDSEAVSETGLALADRFRVYEQLDSYLEMKQVLLLVKFHPAQDMDEIKVNDTYNIKLLSSDKLKKNDIDTYKLLTETDALISDYSSISFDYLLLDKPIAYILSDYETYKLGFAVDNPKEFMPGDYIYNIEDMKQFITDVIAEKDTHAELRHKVRMKVARYNDGHACERITDFFLKKDE